MCLSFTIVIQVDALSQGARALPTSVKSGTKNGVVVFSTINLDIIFLPLSYSIAVIQSIK